MLATLLGPLACLAMGTAGLFAPRAFGSQTGLTAVGPLGRSELRALFGGVFVGLATACLVLGTPSAYWAAAAAFLGGGSAKVLSGVLDHGVFPAALPGIAVDLIAGGLFVWGARSLGVAG
jgi:hypothetical protein